MRIRYRYRGEEKIFDRPVQAVVLGRPRDGLHIDLDLTPDLGVSRPHARISSENGVYWIEDLGSANGTELDGRSIREFGKVRLEPGQAVRISETTIEIDSFVVQHAVREWLSDDTAVLGNLDASLEIFEFNDAAPILDLDKPIDPGRVRDLALLYDLPLRFAEQTDPDVLYQTIIERLVEIIPNAARGALLLEDPATGELLLKAHVPTGEPSVSMTLAARTMSRRQGFLWREGLDPSRSQILNRTKAGMYVPLVWKGRALGVACVDNSEGDTPFSRDDLRLMFAVGNYAAMAAAQHRLQNELQHTSALLGRLLTNFSPKLRRTLLARAAHGRLRPGGERSEVVILASDIRGFTRLTSGMDTDDVMDLLNDYISPLIDVIFKFDGTIDKIKGDDILAVFGSPEPDSLRHEKAIRAASAMQAVTATVSETRKRRGQATCAIGIGVHCGEVLHGFIGTNERMDLTIIGEAANWASRYCAGAAAGEILISPALHAHLWRHIDADMIMIDTKHEGPLRAYRLKAFKGDLTDPH